MSAASALMLSYRSRFWKAKKQKKMLKIYNRPIVSKLHTYNIPFYFNSTTLWPAECTGGFTSILASECFLKTLIRNVIVQHAGSMAILDGRMRFNNNQFAVCPPYQYNNVDKLTRNFWSTEDWNWPWACCLEYSRLLLLFPDMPEATFQTPSALRFPNTCNLSRRAPHSLL